MQRAFIVALVVAAPCAFAASPLIDAGRWEIATEMQLPPGVTMPPSMQARGPMKTTLCFTEEDIRRTGQEFPVSTGNGCQRTDYVAKANHVSFTMTCPQSTMKYDLLVDSRDGYHGTVVAEHEGGGSGRTATFSAKRIADQCTADDLASLGHD